MFQQILWRRARLLRKLSTIVADIGNLHATKSQLLLLSTIGANRNDQYNKLWDGQVLSRCRHLHAASPMMAGPTEQQQQTEKQQTAHEHAADSAASSSSASNDQQQQTNDRFQEQSYQRPEWLDEGQEEEEEEEDAEEDDRFHINDLIYFAFVLTWFPGFPMFLFYVTFILDWDEIKMNFDNEKAREYEEEDKKEEEDRKRKALEMEEELLKESLEVQQREEEGDTVMIGSRRPRLQR